MQSQVLRDVHEVFTRVSKIQHLGPSHPHWLWDVQCPQLNSLPGLVSQATSYHLVCQLCKRQEWRERYTVNCSSLFLGFYPLWLFLLIGVCVCYRNYYACLSHCWFFLLSSTICPSLILDSRHNFRIFLSCQYFMYVCPLLFDCYFSLPTTGPNTSGERGELDAWEGVGKLHSVFYTWIFTSLDALGACCLMCSLFLPEVAVQCNSGKCVSMFKQQNLMGTFPPRF